MELLALREGYRCQEKRAKEPYPSAYAGRE